ncbi:MAG: hypothetical protein ACREAU_01835 [Nitrosopumilaceae archaeon]
MTSAETIAKLLEEYPYLQPVVNKINIELVPLLEVDGITEDEFSDLALDYLDEINLDALLATAEQKAKAVEVFGTIVQLALKAI